MKPAFLVLALVLCDGAFAQAPSDPAAQSDARDRIRDAFARQCDQFQSQADSAKDPLEVEKARSEAEVWCSCMPNEMPRFSAVTDMTTKNQISKLTLEALQVCTAKQQLKQ